MIETLHSAEIRWFFAGPIPEPVQAWFAAGRLGAPAERTDHYLRLPGTDSVGVKQREGRFEIKARCGAEHAMRLGPGVAGRVAAWVKWSYGAEGIEAWLAALRAEPAGWLALPKRRWLRPLPPAARGTAPAAAAVHTAIELTQLTVAGASWWTVGLESAGPAAAVRRQLFGAATRFFADHEPPQPFPLERSFAYPAWLRDGLR